MAYEIKFAKVTNSGKLPDRFLACQHAESPDLAKASMGEIFSIVEIVSPWFPTAQIGQLIINNFIKSYWQGGSTSDLLNFEESLKQVNEGLATATQNGETDWIGKLNSLLAVVIENNLHIAPTGKTEAYIFRDGKINHLTEGLTGGGEVHPLKTFSNIISGELKIHDKILLTSGDIFSHLSAESVRQIITLSNPSMAASQIVKLLKKARVRDINLIVIGLYSQEELSSEPISEDLPTTYYLDKSSEPVTAQLKYIWNNILSPIGKIASGSLVRKKPIQEAGGSLDKVPEKKVSPAESTLDPHKNDRFHREFLNESPRDDSLLKDEEINFSPDYVHYYNSEKKNELKENSFIKIFQKISSGLYSFYEWILAMARDKNRRKYLYISGAIILILIIALFSIFHGKKTKIGNLESQKILDEAITAEKEGSSLLSSGSQEQAKEKFSVAIDKARSILNNALVANDANKVLADTYIQLDKLTATTRYPNLSAIAESPDKANFVQVVSGNVFFIGDTEIFRGSLLGGNTQKVASLPGGKGSIISTTRSDRLIYLFTNDQTVFSYDTSNNKVEQLTLASGKWETANSIAYYSSTLYLLDGILGQIYRHASNTNGSFAAGQTYLANASNFLKQGISMAVDGSIYVLTGTGKVVEYSRSKVQDFTLSGLMTPYETLSEPVKIYTDVDTPSIYILDNSQKRIVEYDKQGAFVHQYALPDSFDKIKDFNVSSKSRKIWVLQANNLYELSI